MSKTRASCFIGVSKHLETIKALGLRPRAFICFSVFWYPDETFALVLEIVPTSQQRLEFWWSDRKQYCPCDKISDKDGYFQVLQIITSPYVFSYGCVFNHFRIRPQGSIIIESPFASRSITPSRAQSQDRNCVFEPQWSICIRLHFFYIRTKSINAETVTT